MSLLLLWACATGGAPGGAGGAEIFVESPQVKSGEAVLLHAPLDVALPEVAGLKLEPSGVDGEGKGIWKVQGPDGSYILTFPGESPEAAPRAQLFVDIGVPGPKAGELEDLVLPPPPPAPVWPWVLAAVACLGLLAAALAWAIRRFTPKAAPVPPEPPWVVARREWEALRQRSDLSPEQLALSLSDVYRRYLEASHGWPATSRTTGEIVDNLASELTAAQLSRARRLLGAMDLVKFADRESREGFFEALDADFHDLVVVHG